MNKGSTVRPMAISVGAHSKEWVCGHSLAGIAGSNLTGGMDMSLVIVVHDRIKISAPS